MRRACVRLLEDGVAHGVRTDLQRGGLRRSRRRCDVTDSIASGREGWAFDERVLGSSDFVRALQQHELEPRPPVGPPRPPFEILPGLIDRVALASDLSGAERCSGSKRRSVVRARRSARVPRAPPGRTSRVGCGPCPRRDPACPQPRSPAWRDHRSRTWPSRRRLNSRKSIARRYSQPACAGILRFFSTSL